MTFLEAALQVLRREGKPLHYKDIADRAVAKGLLTLVGRTPAVTMQTQLTAAVNKAPGNPFVRTGPGCFGLLRYPPLSPEEQRAYDAAGTPDARGDEGGERGDRAQAVPGEGGGRRRRGRAGRGREPGGEPDAGMDTAGPLDEESGASPEEVGARAPGAHEVSEEDEEDDLEDPGAVGAGDPASRPATGSGASAGRGLDGEPGSGRRRRRRRRRRGGADSGTSAMEESTEEVFSVSGEALSSAPGEAPGLAPEDGGPSEAPGEQTSGEGTEGSAAPEGGAEEARRILAPIDAAIEILRSQSPGRGVHVRQIADAAIRRRLVHGEAHEAWRVLRAALSAEPRERLRSGLRPRVRAAGSGLYALARRPADPDLERAEQVFGEARRALRERTLAALEQRLAELSPGAFEALGRVLLQREGFGPATFVKRVEGTVYLEALRGRGWKPSRCLIALRAGPAAAGRRAVGELRAGVRARGLDEGLLLLAGRLAEDGIAEWKQAGPPVEVADGAALAEVCARHGVGVLSATVNVEFVDADFFAELAEG